MLSRFSGVPRRNYRVLSELTDLLRTEGVQWTVVKGADLIVLMLGRPRPSPTQQSRLLIAARLWLYDLAGCNVVQHQLEIGDTVIGWLITVNYKNPDREGIVKWLSTAS